MPFKDALLKTAELLGAPLGGAASNDLAVTVPIQIRSNWCWSAVTLGVDNFYGPANTFTQCSLASLTLGRSDCCDDPTPNDCNIPYFLNIALNKVGHLKSFGGVFAMSQVQAEIDADKPLCARVEWSDGNGHFVVISGYDVATDSLTIRDPYYGTSTVTMTRFKSSYQTTGRWTHSFKTQP